MQGFESSQLLKFEWVEVHRRVKTVYVDGKPVDKPDRSFRIRASVQPLSGRDLLLVPEGQRFKEQYFVYTLGDVESRDLIRLPEDGSIEEADGPKPPPSPLKFKVNYQIQEVEFWSSYRRARIMRVDTGPEATP